MIINKELATENRRALVALLLIFIAIAFTSIVRGGEIFYFIISLIISFLVLHFGLKYLREYAIWVVLTVIISGLIVSFVHFQKSQNSWLILSGIAISTFWQLYSIGFILAKRQGDSGSADDQLGAS